jgi:hypothetical protein
MDTNWSYFVDRVECGSQAVTILHGVDFQGGLSADTFEFINESLFIVYRNDHRPWRGTLQLIHRSHMSWQLTAHGDEFESLPALITSDTQLFSAFSGPVFITDTINQLPLENDAFDDLLPLRGPDWVGVVRNSATGYRIDLYGHTSHTAGDIIEGLCPWWGCGIPSEDQVALRIRLE